MTHETLTLKLLEYLAFCFGDGPLEEFLLFLVYIGTIINIHESLGAEVYLYIISKSFLAPPPPRGE